MNLESVPRAPRHGVMLMIVVLVAMALLALNANVQRARRAQIENVTIIRVSPTVTPAASITR